MADIHVTPEAIRAHADTVADVAAGVLDGAAAGIRDIPNMNFGIISAPTIYPPILALFGMAETGLTALGGLGGDLAAGLYAMAELYEVAESATKTQIEKAGNS